MYVIALNFHEINSEVMVTNYKIIYQNLRIKAPTHDLSKGLFIDAHGQSNSRNAQFLHRPITNIIGSV